MEEVLSNFVEVLLQAIIVAVVPAAVALAVSWIKVQQKKLEAQLPADVMNAIRSVASLVTLAAEQSGLNGYLIEAGLEKKDWAMAEGEKLLKQHLGLVLDLDKLGDAFWESVVAGLDASIEAEVLSQNAWGGFRKEE